MSQERDQHYLKRPKGSPTFLTPTNPSKKRVPRRLLHNVSGRSSRRRLPIRDDHSSCSSSQTAVSGNRGISRDRNVGTYTSNRHTRVSTNCWRNAEIKTLVEFVLFHCEGNKWPSHHRMDFGKLLPHLL